MLQIRLDHHKNSGRLRPHEFTSYAGLGLLLLVVGGVLAGYTGFAMAQNSPGPSAGSLVLEGTVPGKPPADGAHILLPAGPQTFGKSPITVSGTCPKGVIVELFKNSIFAGSTVCADDGTFESQIDLMLGDNELSAKVYDALSQEGPASNTVTVTYNGIPLQAAGLSPINLTTSDQLLLNTDAVFRGVFPEQDMIMPIDIIGGAPPYAINVQWGDATNKVVSRDNNLSFQMTHTYQKPGTYPITVQATDTAGRVAFLMVASIVNGQPASAASGSDTTVSKSTLLSGLLVMWPLYVGLIGIVLSFWLGERREKDMLARHGVVYH